MKILEDKNRIFGLDLVRALAIIFVLVAHIISYFIIPFAQNKFTAGVLGRVFSYPLGFFGVEIFFVLSGYLIGSILIKKVIQSRSIKELFNFYIRRWFRTLPLYFLVVFLLLFDPYTNYNFSWKNLVFLQNFDLKAIEYNFVSWSLSVEEWFYLLIPLLFLLIFIFYKRQKESKVFLFSCVSIVFVSILARILLVNYFNPDFNYGIRRSIFLRLDSLTIGVFFAGIKFYYQNIFNYLKEKQKQLFVFSMIGMFLSFLYLILHGQSDLNVSFFARVLFFPVVSIFCGLLIISLENINKPKYFANKITSISLISYGLYLIHSSIFVIFFNIFKVENFYFSILVSIFFFVFTFVVSYLLYKFYEFPFMRLRVRIKF